MDGVQVFVRGSAAEVANSPSFLYLNTGPQRPLAARTGQIGNTALRLQIALKLSHAGSVGVRRRHRPVAPTLRTDEARRGRRATTNSSVRTDAAVINRLA